MLSDRRPLVTLHDAAFYVAELPKAEYDTEQRQAAMEAPMLVVENDEPAMLARISVMRALDHGNPNPATAPRRERTKATRIL